MRISLALLPVIAVVAGAAAAPDAAASRCSQLQAKLSGAAIGSVTPTGRGDWRGTPQCTGVELKVEIRSVNLGDGTLLTLETCDRQWTLTLVKREARFESKQSVPICTVGSPLSVRHGATTILSATWCNPLFARCD